MSMAELKAAVESSSKKVLKNLLYFAAPIPETRQYLRFKTDQAISLVKFVRITSQDIDMFNFF